MKRFLLHQVSLRWWWLLLCFGFIVCLVRLDEPASGQANTHHRAYAPWSGDGVTKIWTMENLGIHAEPTAPLDINGDTIRLRQSRTPAARNAPGGKGEICFDSNYFYICIDTDTWRRIPLQLLPLL